ncbi:unnamed protein product, partial [marine sediment metagenome]
MNGLDKVQEEVEVHDIWDMLTVDGIPYYGTGTKIAIIDSGIDWRHPSFYYPLNSYKLGINNTFAYIDFNNDGLYNGNSENLNFTHEELLFTNGTALSNLTMFDPGIDYIYNDINVNGIRDDGESFFIFDDKDSNKQISLNDEVLELNYIKIHKIWETRTNTLYERGVNLTNPLVNFHVDVDGHGTHIANIIAGGIPRFNKFTGIAPEADLLIVKARDDSTGSYSESDVIDGIDWAVKEGAHVISISLGFYDNKYRDGSDLLDAKVDWAQQQ